MAEVHAVTEIAGVYRVEPVVHTDNRGLFVETYRRSWIPGGREMVQANRGDRQAGTVVGLHYHRFQSDYWYVPFGTIRVVLFDLRTASPTEGAVWTTDLGRQTDGSHCHDGVFIPPGVGHGFAALSDCTLSYLVDGYYDPADELGVAWNDPAVTVDWGIADPTLSDRDAALPGRDELVAELRPRWSAAPVGSEAKDVS
jgi:dTDP-4-dehydrorhamnose 3,5-epimerase